MTSVGVEIQITWSVTAFAGIVYCLNQSVIAGSVNYKFIMWGVATCPVD